MSYRLEILKAAFEQREREVVEYQVNIDNYRLAIDHIGEDEDLQEFKEHIRNLLQSSIVEQKKAKVILDVIKQQLEA
jgi:hypothetical protein